MKVLALVLCFIGMCWASPSHEKISAAVADTVNEAAPLIQKRDIQKRAYIDDVRNLFNFIDTNGDKMVTADEFATFYAKYDPRKTFAEWKDAFIKSLAIFDFNKNGKYEFLEFYVIALYGQAQT